jgi:hypothetical protein
MQQRLKLLDGFVSARHRKEMTEIEQQAQCVKLRQLPSHAIPSFYEFRTLRHGGKKRFQDGRCIVIETQMGRCELLFQNGHPREKRK